MPCLIDLHITNQVFPAHRIIDYSITTTRQRHPIYMMNSNSPRSYTNGKTEVRARIEFAGLTNGEFQRLFKFAESRTAIGPITLKKNEEDCISITGSVISLNCEGRRWENTVEIELLVESLTGQSGGQFYETNLSY